ncbi:MAG TPA: MgtC/SapB family protein [Acetivibrio clariflavus]|nr:MgtC/SapB family protein [Acetivibrio clariflavus]
MKEIIANMNLEFYLTTLFRLLLACILGGLIGYERESMKRPAGFRTHILVCMGSALVMLTSEYIFMKYKGSTNMDPARLGAQVVSGIGFLGAGTIIREGANVKGLTTAASLWAVSCVGIAAGIGFYGGAVVAALVIYLTLMVLKKLEHNLANRKYINVLYIKTSNLPGQIGAIGNILGKNNININNIEFLNNEDDADVLIKLYVRIPNDAKKKTVMGELQKIEGVSKVYEE